MTTMSKWIPISELPINNAQYKICEGMRMKENKKKLEPDTADFYFRNLLAIASAKFFCTIYSSILVAVSFQYFFDENLQGYNSLSIFSWLISFSILYNNQS